MLSKNKQKLITSLARKKHRDQEQLFVAEGHKLVDDLLTTSLKCKILIATDEWLNSNKNYLNNTEIINASLNEIKKVSSLKSTPPVMAVFEQPATNFDYEQLSTKLSLFLDDIQDPGNLGTIVRMADWFGIEDVFCTKGCADIYNSKTVQSTMGAIARVKVHYIEAANFFDSIDNVEIYGTFLEGDNLYQTDLKANGIIVMGNEGNGISKEVEKYVSTKINIPNYPPESATSESLNVAVATAITCAEFRRQLAF
ncbi:TrmH family RNA methyltransferase [Carboxylicivirga linearis]|uniref:RNA methyltransferase n=1 Tax=Carboxylicivirga linearis TaxID=1628157 RepID=A0ABS5K069_9BACT|nr:RNA methyltransferase [Carboxylicivirga linearis]MBS2100134.1 RNA methyltransferase [Carboxylicivirga linearis]